MLIGVKCSKSSCSLGGTTSPFDENTSCFLSTPSNPGRGVPFPNPEYRNLYRMEFFGVHTQTQYYGHLIPKLVLKLTSPLVVTCTGLSPVSKLQLCWARSYILKKSRLNHNVIPLCLKQLQGLFLMNYFCEAKKSSTCFCASAQTLLIPAFSSDSFIFG